MFASYFVDCVLCRATNERKTLPRYFQVKRPTTTNKNAAEKLSEKYVNMMRSRLCRLDCISPAEIFAIDGRHASQLRGEQGASSARYVPSSVASPLLRHRGRNAEDRKLDTAAWQRRGQQRRQDTYTTRALTVRLLPMTGSILHCLDGCEG